MDGKTIRGRLLTEPLDDDSTGIGVFYWWARDEPDAEWALRPRAVTDAQLEQLWARFALEVDEETLAAALAPPPDTSDDCEGGRYCTCQKCQEEQAYAAEQEFDRRRDEARMNE